MHHLFLQSHCQGWLLRRADNISTNNLQLTVLVVAWQMDNLPTIPFPKTQRISGSCGCGEHLATCQKLLWSPTHSKEHKLRVVLITPQDLKLLPVQSISARNQTLLLWWYLKSIMQKYVKKLDILRWLAWKLRHSDIFRFSSKVLREEHFPTIVALHMDALQCLSNQILLQRRFLNQFFKHKKEAANKWNFRFRDDLICHPPQSWCN